MVDRVSHLLVALAVTLGLLVPQSAGLAALAGVAEGRVMVICTGDGLRTLRIADDGRPAETSETAERCALAQATDTATAAVPPPACPALLFTAAPVLPQAQTPVRPACRVSLPRAPPSA